MSPGPFCLFTTAIVQQKLNIAVVDDRHPNSFDLVLNCLYNVHSFFQYLNVEQTVVSIALMFGSYC
jgi:hypothetical protein